MLHYIGDVFIFIGADCFVGMSHGKKKRTSYRRY